MYILGIYIYISSSIIKNHFSSFVGHPLEEENYGMLVKPQLGRNTAYCALYTSGSFCIYNVT